MNKRKHTSIACLAQLLMDKPVKDISDLFQAMNSLNKELNYLENRFIALGLDYQNYYSKSKKKERVFELRNNVLFRIFSAQFLFKLLIDHELEVEKGINHNLQNHPDQKNSLFFPHNLYGQDIKEIQALFDSLTFNLVSVFDYFSSLISFFLSYKPDSYTKWNSLMDYVRSDPRSDNSLIIHLKLMNNSFVNNLSGYRSDLIHESPKMMQHNLTYHAVSNSIDFKCYSPTSFNKKFSELKNMEKDYRLTMRFASFWLINHTILQINNILFLLDEFIIDPSIPIDKLLYTFKKPNGEIVSAANNFWFKEEYIKLLGIKNL